jgi:DNA-binding transcriptional regulator LsrR (DeoR family)
MQGVSQVLLVAERVLVGLLMARRGLAVSSTDRSQSMGKKKKTQKKSTKAGQGTTKFRLEDKSTEERRDYLERFATGLSEFLQGISEGGWKKIMDDLKVDSRQFDKFLRHLYRDQYLQIRYHRLSELADKLKEKDGFKDLQEITVVAGSDKDRFARAAAEGFIKRMVELARHKRQAGEGYLNVGIVSGSTTGNVIGEAMKMKWSQDLQDASFRELGVTVRTFALNVCLTAPEHLPGNATILAYQLASKIKDEGGLAEGYGLSAPLIVKKDDLILVDEAPETFDVLRYTEPARVQRKLDKMGKSVDAPTDTQLDIVLTGVGELPGPGQAGDQEPEGSIFYTLATGHGFDMDAIIKRERIVGDIAFTAIRSDGTSVALKKHDHGGNAEEKDSQQDSWDYDGGTEYMFYSAVQMPVLSEMAKKSDKSVIVVAKHDPKKYKVPAIFASIAGQKNRCASRLVVDEETARQLYRY